jgi:hypothetical protein
MINMICSCLCVSGFLAVTGHTPYPQPCSALGSPPWMHSTLHNRLLPLLSTHTTVGPSTPCRLAGEQHLAGDQTRRLHAARTVLPLQLAASARSMSQQHLAGDWRSTHGPAYHPLRFTVLPHTHSKQGPFHSQAANTLRETRRTTRLGLSIPNGSLRRRPSVSDQHG